MTELSYSLESFAENAISQLHSLQSLPVPLIGNLQLFHRLQDVLDTVMISNQQGLIEFLVQIGNEVTPGPGRHLKGKLFHLHSQVVDPFDCLWWVDEVLNFVW